MKLLKTNLLFSPISIWVHDSLDCVACKTVPLFQFILKIPVKTETGRGLMTKKKILPGEIIISIPEQLLITTRTVLQSEIHDIVKSWTPKLSPQQAIAVFLIWEFTKGRQSHWFQYIAVLPMSFATPLYFKKAELSLLPVSVYSKAVKEIQKIKTAYNDIASFSKEHWKEFHDVFNFNNFRWAWYVINTRSVFFKGENSEYLSCDKNDIALAPFLDMLNHSSHANIQAGFNHTTHCYEIKTFDKYKPYEQVFISYGPHNNSHLFIEYGFITLGNPQDVYDFSYDDLEHLRDLFHVDLWEKKINILRENSLLQSLSISLEGLSWKLWTVLQTLAMDWNQLQKWNLILQDKVEGRNEMKVLAISFAKSLLQRAWSSHLEQEKKSHIISLADIQEEHMNLAMSLLEIQKKILSETIRIVNSINFDST
ncbi:hypothetical protein CHS0354_030008 [Potamilus streckersoni]|uniref:SET domain-containing protein n=1 Tax=Potamilus streckersoni TaxID=2493646 RepID=A0AAE0SN61_9BIVA|nr:hypothetical protein CHS0354_030008 [Potamilus streckersoni]